MAKVFYSLNQGYIRTELMTWNDITQKNCDQTLFQKNRVLVREIARRYFQRDI